MLRSVADHEIWGLSNARALELKESSMSWGSYQIYECQLTFVLIESAFSSFSSETCTTNILIKIVSTALPLRYLNVFRSLGCSLKLHLFNQKYSKNCNIVKYHYRQYSSLQCHMILQKSFMLIWCLRHISYYYQCWKQLCCLIFLIHSFKDSLMNRKLWRTAFIWN